MSQYAYPLRASLAGRVKTLTRVYLRQWGHQPLYLLAMIVSFALVMISVTFTFSVREGLRATLEASAEPGLYFMTNAQTYSELSSQLDASQVLYVKRLKSRADHGYSAELALLTRQTPDGEEKEFILRGVQAAAFSLSNPVNRKPYAKIIDGRMFSAGSNEVIVGAALEKHYPAYRVGGTVLVRGQAWKITGVFASNGSVRESEFWADWDHLRTDYGLGAVYSVVVFGGPENNSAQYTAELEQMDKDQVTVRDSLDHYARQGKDLLDLLLYFGLVFSALTGLVAISGIAALVESLLINQAHDIKMLFQIGYGRERFIACMVQIALLGLSGGIIGMIVSLLSFSGVTFTTFTESRELTFSVATSASVLSIAIIYCVVIGCVAGALVVPRLRGKGRG